jgi:hypothetical protein
VYRSGLAGSEGESNCPNPIVLELNCAAGSPSLSAHLGGRARGQKLDSNHAYVRVAEIRDTVDV